MKTNLIQYLSSVYFVSQPLHVSAIFIAHNQEVYCIYMYIYTLYIYSNWYVLCFLVGMSVSRVGMGRQQTVNCTAQHVPIAVYIQYTS